MRDRIFAAQQIAAQVDVEYFVPDVDWYGNGIGIERMLGRVGHRGIIVEDIKPPEMADGRLDHRFDRSRDKRIELYGKGCIAKRFCSSLG